MSAQSPPKPAAQGAYEVSRPQGLCAVTGNPINPGDKFFAALRETATGLERLDISLSAWPDFDKKELLASWQTTMPQPDVKKKIFVDDEVLCGLFERLASTSEPAKLNFRFVLGLILMRKRLLIYETTRMENGNEIWTMRFKGREDTLDMLNPKLNEEQVGEVSHQLGEILNEDL